MHAFETLLLILFGAVLLSLLAHRLKAPFPPFLALGGAAAAFLPNAPQLTLDPALVLALFVAPVLLDAAYDSSPRDLKRNAVPITLLTLAAVGVTITAVAVTARALMPEISWPVAVALGAIVAPPDAAAATAVLRAVPVPYRVRVILEGEGLFNDASALLVYRFAVVAATTGLTFGWVLIGTLAWTLVGSALFGAALGWLTPRLTSRIEDAPSAILLQFIISFGVWIAAERLGLSAIVTIVVYALVVAVHTARRVRAPVRVPSYAVWETVAFALNAAAFALVGLQIGPIWRDLTPEQRGPYAAFALTILGVAVIARIVWVMGYNTVLRLKNRLFGTNLRAGDTPPTAKAGLVIAWAGMRGVISLAAAYALPEGFPQRDLILLTTFAVVMGTLVVQGLTLGPLIRLLGLGDDGVLHREIRLAREAVAVAALDHVRDAGGPHADRLIQEYQVRLDSVRGEDSGDGRVELESDQLKSAVLEAKRDALHDLLSRGEIGDAAYYQLEEELDRHELSLTPVVR